MCGYDRRNRSPPGGSFGNLYALNLSRHHKFPQVREEGMQAVPPLCVFTSSLGHYSLRKGTAFLGYGTKNLILVDADENGKMIPSKLESAIVEAKEKGLHPVMVNATAASTVVGAYDPLDDIADICKRHNIWFHVDGAWGGSVLMSKNHRHIMKGIERADSIVWCQHKLLGIPLQCSAFVTRHKGLMKQAHSADARYLFQQDKFYDVNYDTGDAAVQCSRKIDVLKFWLSWKAHGDLGMQQRVDNAFEMTKYLTERVRKTEGFRLIFEPEYLNICFFYIPPSMRNQEETPEWWQKLNTVAPTIKERMVTRGTMMVCYQPLEPLGLVNFFRMIVNSPGVTKQDLDFVIDEIDNLGKDL